MINLVLELCACDLCVLEKNYSSQISEKNSCLIGTWRVSYFTLTIALFCKRKFRLFICLFHGITPLWLLSVVGSLWNLAIYWFRFNGRRWYFLPFGLRGHGLLFLLLPDVLPASVAGIFWALAPVMLFGVCWKLSAYIVVRKCCDVITCMVVVQAMSCGWSAAIPPLRVTVWISNF